MTEINPIEKKELEAISRIENEFEIKALLRSLENLADAKWDECKKLHARKVRAQNRLIEICDPLWIERQKKLKRPDAGDSLFKFLEFVD